MSQSTAAHVLPALRPPRRRTRWFWVRRALLVAALGVLLLAATLAGVSVWFVQRTLPQTGGTIAVPGLRASVSVLRDQWGVPHITGENLHDVVFAQGYVTAQDRYFQMEFSRRVAAGRLAEMFGPGPNNSLIEADAFLRTLALPTAAAAELAALDARTREMLSAYTDGVNAFRTSHLNALPLEFSILGVTPQPWSMVDSLAYGRVVALSLDNTWYTKYTRAMVQAHAGASISRALFPPYPSGNPTLFSDAAAAGATTGPTPSPTASAVPRPVALAPAALRGALAVRQILGGISDALGSNNWVVDGTHSVTGKPLLANDPHLGIRMPGIWYEVALRGGGLDVIGFSFPGLPGVVVGHNRYIAWGVTNTGADNADLYLETLDPVGHPGQYERQGQWVPLATRQETIVVRGRATPVRITVAATDHGPLLNGVVADLKGYTPVALKWTALQPGYTFAGFFQLDFATNWAEFDAALANISISQNFVYADTNGNIGYRMSGLLPQRPPANGLGPVSGDVRANEWHGYLPDAQMPRLYNPPTHAIVTANNRILPESDVRYVTNDWDYGYRAARITQVLDATRLQSVETFAALQSDVLSLPAARLTPLLVAAGQQAGGDAAAAARLLQGWDGQMTRASTAAAVFEVTASALLREAIVPRLGADLYAVYRSNVSASRLYTVLIEQLTGPVPVLYGGSAATRDAAVAHALGTAMAELRARFGADTAAWRWGALHTAAFEHPLATVRPLDRVFGVPPLERPGDTMTVNVGGNGGFSKLTPDYTQRAIPSMRQILDLANFDNSRWIAPAGESGQPFSAHYTDLLPLWDAGRYQQMAFSLTAVARAATAVLTLTPR